MKTIIKSRIQWPSLMGLALLGLHLGAGDLKAQTTVSNPQTAVEITQTPTAQDQKIQQLPEKLDEIQKERIELKRANSAPAGDTSLHDFESLCSTTATSRPLLHRQPFGGGVRDNRPLQSKSGLSLLPTLLGSRAIPAPRTLPTRLNSLPRSLTSTTRTTSAIRKTTL